MELPRLELQRL